MVSVGILCPQGNITMREESLRQGNDAWCSRPGPGRFHFLLCLGSDCRLARWVFKCGSIHCLRFSRARHHPVGVGVDAEAIAGATIFYIYGGYLLRNYEILHTSVSYKIVRRDGNCVNPAVVFFIIK